MITLFWKGIVFSWLQLQDRTSFTVSNGPFHGRLSSLSLRKHAVFMRVILTFLLLNSAEVEGEEERTR